LALVLFVQVASQLFGIIFVLQVVCQKYLFFLLTIVGFCAGGQNKLAWTQIWTIVNNKIKIGKICFKTKQKKF